jgi:hypothetical protein
VHFVIEIYDHFSHIADATNALIACLLNITKRNLDWKMFKYR